MPEPLIFFRSNTIILILLSVSACFITDIISANSTSGAVSGCSSASLTKASIGSISCFCSTTSPVMFNTNAEPGFTTMVSSPPVKVSIKINNTVKNTKLIIIFLEVLSRLKKPKVIRATILLFSFIKLVCKTFCIIYATCY